MGSASAFVSQYGSVTSMPWLSLILCFRLSLYPGPYMPAMEVSTMDSSISDINAPLPSPSSLIVSFKGRAKRFRKSSFVGHRPSSGCISGVPNMAAPEKEATPSTTPRAKPLPRSDGNVRSGAELDQIWKILVVEAYFSGQPQHLQRTLPKTG